MNNGVKAQPGQEIMMSTNLPIEISNRPFAIEQEFQTMMPDGIFDLAFKRYLIAFHVTNVSDISLKMVWVRPARGVPTEWDYVAAHFQTELAPMAPGASKLILWPADFTRCTVGKKTIDIEYGVQPDWEAGGYDGILKKSIFVSKTIWDQNKKVYICTVPEGSMEQSQKSSSYLSGWKLTEVNDGVATEFELPKIGVADELSSLVVSRPGYENSIPFQDPWWKAVAFLLAVLAGLIAYKKASGGLGLDATVNPDESGDGLENWCNLVEEPSSQSKNEAAALSIISGSLFLVAYSDIIDPWQRSRNAIGPQPSSRLSELVTGKLTVPDKLKPGAKWSIPVEWTYSAAYANGDVLTNSAKETQETHRYIAAFKKNVPKSVVLGRNCVVSLYLEDQHGSPWSADGLYGYALFFSPDGQKILRFFQNIDAETGAKLPSGEFQAVLDTDTLHPVKSKGRWKVKLFGQAVNEAKDGMLPHKAATFIGGCFLFAPFTLSRTDGESATCEEENTDEVDFEEGQ